MNDKIKPALPWINVGLIIVILVSAQYLFSSVLNLGSADRWISIGFNLTILPGWEILRYTTLETINWFGGSEYPFTQFVRSAGVSAVGLIVLLILVPWFFIRGFMHKTSEHQPSGLMWYLASTVLIIGITASTLHVVKVNIINSDNQQSIQSSRTVDELRNYMMNVAFDASEWWILPVEAGGGNGSFSINRDESLALNDLKSYDPEHPDFEMRIDDVPSDSAMIIKGVIESMPDENGSKRELIIEITPYNDSLFRFL